MEVTDDDDQPLLLSLASVGMANAPPSNLRSLSSKRQSKYGHKTPSLERLEAADGSDSDSSQGSFFSSPRRPEPTELSKSGTLHLGGFMVRESGLARSPAEPRKRTGKGLSQRRHSAGSPAENDRLFSHEDLVEINRLGKGASGIVFRALHITSFKLVAIKAVPVYDSVKRAQMITELKALYGNSLSMRASGNEYILEMFDAFVKKSDSTINLVLEWMNGGSLQDYIDKRGALKEKQIASVLHCCLRGLQELHTHRLLHRDIKPSNILVSKSTGQVKLSDFGIAHSFGSFSAAKTFIGSLSYMAPERISSDEDGYSYAADVWSIGLSALVCACGRYPYQSDYDEQGYFGLVHAITELPSPHIDDLLPGHNFSPELGMLIDWCLSKDPALRPTPQELLHHTFLSEVHPFESTHTAFVEPLVDETEAWSSLNKMADIISTFHFEKCKRLDHTFPRIPRAKVKNLALQLGISEHSKKFEGEISKIVTRLSARGLIPKK